VVTLTVPLSTQVYKCVKANVMLGVTLPWTNITYRGSRNTLSQFMPLKREKRPPDEPTVDLTRLFSASTKKKTIKTH